MLCRICKTDFTPAAWNVSSRDYRCAPCKRDAQNAKNRQNAEVIRAKALEAYKQRKGYFAEYQRKPEVKAKRAARRKVATEIEAGRMARSACEVCGHHPAEAHHDDYTKPLEVRWLCRLHHEEHHLLNVAILRAREAA